MIFSLNITPMGKRQLLVKKFCWTGNVASTEKFEVWGRDDQNSADLGRGLKYRSTHEYAWFLSVNSASNDKMCHFIKNYILGPPGAKVM